MRSLAALIVSIVALFAHPLMAQQINYEFVIVEEVVWPSGGSRFVETQSAAIPSGIAAYGPFRVLDGTRAALVGATDDRSPAAFAAMLQDFPRIALIEMVECPGTEDDRANLQVGRMIRRHGIATYVPAGGSVRSGGVELFLAGARRFADPEAEFAVHAWADETGLEPDDYAASSPENRKYLDYYRQMGMSPAEADAFYAMTNSVAHEDALWLTAEQMSAWVRFDNPASQFVDADSLTQAPSFSNGPDLMDGRLPGRPFLFARLRAFMLFRGMR